MSAAASLTGPPPPVFSWQISEVRQLRSTRLPLASAVLLLALVAGCEPMAPIDPDNPFGDSGNGGGGVQRAVLEVVVEVVAEDAAIAQALGWAERRIPDTEVRVEGTGFSETLVSGPDGTVRLEDLLPGSYTISVERMLTAEELPLVEAVEAGVLGFAGGQRISVLSPATTRTFSLGAGRRGSLVISEFVKTLGTAPGGAEYRFGGYIELYNNSDTLIYLDGKVLGHGWDYSGDYAPNFPCSMFEDFRNDPEGIWSRLFYRFPGAGTDYPLAPGQTAVIATDAIDHTQFATGVVDLSGANFETVGGADVDNPAVPNLINIGPFEHPFGHGLMLGVLVQMPFIAEPLVVAELEGRREPSNGNLFYRIPREKLIDVAVARVPDLGGIPWCPELIHRSIDRQEAISEASWPAASLHRRVFGELEDGRLILQRTFTSGRDFELRAPAPGRIQR
jgi:hypothetical protein